jgi:hypothetical protein
MRMAARTRVHPLDVSFEDWKITEQARLVTPVQGVRQHEVSDRHSVADDKRRPRR